MDFETIAVSAIVPVILSLVTAIVVSYLRDVSFKVRLEARSRYLEYLEKQLADLYLPLYERFFGLFKHTDEFVFDAPADLSRDNKIVWYFEQKKAHALKESSIVRDEDEATNETVATAKGAFVSVLDAAKFGLPGVPALFSELETIVADKVYLMTPDLQKLFVLLTAGHRMREDWRITSEKMAGVLQADLLSLKKMKAEVEKKIESAEKNSIDFQNDEESRELIEYKNEVFEQFENAEKRLDEVTETLQKTSERLETNEKVSLRSLSKFMNQIFSQYEHITQEHEKEIQQYRHSIDSKRWFR